MNPFGVLYKWFWVIFIMFTFGNAAIFRARAKKHIRQNSELEEGYRKIIKGF